MTIKVTEQGFDIDGQLVPLYSGSIHYWRLERDLWSDLLDNVIRMGFKIVETYIPWAIHEIEEGKYDFGQIDKNKDLNAFLTMCREKDLKVLVRPGPHINAELTLFGYPERIIYDKEIQAKTPWGTAVIYPYFSKQFPLPSYASEKLYNETEKYFDALLPILLKHQYPKGAIIAIQSDNETNYFFRDRAYILDYAKDSIKLYRQMLREKYGDISVLNKVYKTTYESLEVINPPSGFKGKDKEDLPYYFDWIEYKEYQIAYTIKRIAAMWKSKGIIVPIYHNIAYQHYTPIDLINFEKSKDIDIVGIDIYANEEGVSGVREKVRYLAGSSTLPYVPEFGSGVWYDHSRTFLPKEEEFITLYSFMNGLKAINYYMLVERERWQGSPITRDNRIRTEYFDFYKKFNEFLDKEKFHLFKRTPEVLVMKNFDMGRFKSLYSIMDLQNFSSNTLIKGFELPTLLFKPNVNLNFRFIDEEYSYWGDEKWIASICEKLLAHNVDFNLSDTHLSFDNMCKYNVVFASTYDFMDGDEQRKLLDYVKQGGTLVIGPGIPYLDRNMKEYSIIREALNLNSKRTQLEMGEIIYIKEPNTTEIGCLNLNKEYSNSNKEVEICLPKDVNRELLFIANITNSTQYVEVGFDGRRQFRAVWNGEDASGEGSIKIKIGPYSVFVWEIKHL